MKPFGQEEDLYGLVLSYPYSGSLSSEFGVFLEVGQLVFFSRVFVSEYRNHSYSIGAGLLLVLQIFRSLQDIEIAFSVRHVGNCLRSSRPFSVYVRILHLLYVDRAACVKRQLFSVPELPHQSVAPLRLFGQVWKSKLFLEELVETKYFFPHISYILKDRYRIRIFFVY